ncbi:hypothetical protein PYCCODRAFT_439566 [Trametes coccinea BRFM310]|uniref:Uncharacterized protein n=1 Tax=Trametes coccinea (strain BRFM310) TaxID=1353009 RepID=A0A1Y2IPA6_TRAC3|nr:hypothetical protein PYCCODRAFT_439566 [Trametes coccinea BRFM310]
MKFFSVAPVFAAIAFGAMSVVAEGASAIVRGFDQITEQSAYTRSEVDRITFSDAYREFPIVVEDLHDIVRSIHEFNVKVFVSHSLEPPPTQRVICDCGRLQQANPLGGDDAKFVVSSLISFVETQQDLLDVVIEKQPIASHSLFTAPIADVLHDIALVIDRLSLDVLAIIPTETDHAKAQFTSLELTLQEAFNIYKV